MATVRLSPQFLRDFDDIIERLAASGGIPTAIDYARQIRASTNQLVDFPGLGSPRAQLGKNVRMLIVQPYLIFYDGVPKSADVLVLRVLHQSRRITRKSIAAGRDT